jgi:hypothetical protein
MTSLEGWGSTIELRPRAAPAWPFAGPAWHVVTGSVPASGVSRSTGSGLTWPPVSDRYPSARDMISAAGPSTARESGWTDKLRSA